MMHINFIFSGLVILSSSLGFCFSNQYYKISPPPGWHEEPQAFGADVIMGGPIKADLGTPVVSITTTAASLSAKVNLKSVLKLSIESQFKKTPSASRLKIVKEGKVNSAAPNYMEQYEYVKDGVPLKNLIVIFSGDKSFHVLSFSTNLKYFNDYSGEVLKSASTFSFNKN